MFGVPTRERRNVDLDEVVIIDDEENEVQATHGPIRQAVAAPGICRRHRQQGGLQAVAGPVGPIRQRRREARARAAPYGPSQNNNIRPVDEVEAVPTLLPCPVCMNSSIGRHPVVTRCGHVFCRNCINAALQVKKECPTCRTRLAGRNTLIDLYP